MVMFQVALSGAVRFLKSWAAFWLKDFAATTTGESTRYGADISAAVPSWVMPKKVRTS